MDMREFFRDRVRAALSRRELEVTETTEFYLVELLARNRQLSPGRETLAERLGQALTATSRRERLRAFRDAGDSALVAAGLFFDYLERRGISRDYVVAIGCRAYASAGELAFDSPVAEAYPELSNSFEEFARVFDDVRESTELRTPQDIVRLYERWQQTRSPLLAERLRAAGVYPGSGLLH